MPVLSAALNLSPALRTAPMEYAVTRLAINVLLFLLSPISFALQTAIVLTQTTAVNFTSVLETEPRNTLAPTTLSTAIRRMLAYARVSALTALSSNVNTRVYWNKSFIPRTPTFMVSAFVISQH